jgi:hypothetical protein
MRTTLTFLLLALALSCRNEPAIEKARWLAGTWEQQTARGSVFESWQRDGDRALAGQSYRLRAGDTVFLESIRLVQEGDRLLYIPTVSDQNDSRPIRFTSKKITGTELVFENPAHDFPQEITYRRVHSDSLVAEIAGVQNGKARREVFAMKRRNP